MYWENSVHFIAKKFHSPRGKETVQKLKTFQCPIFDHDQAYFINALHLD